MAGDRTKDGFKNQELEAFRAQQEEMLNLSREYGRARQAAWTEEMRALEESWAAFSQEWQGTLEQMSSQAGDIFTDITRSGKNALADLSGELEDWGEHFLKTLEKVSLAWLGNLGGQGGGGGGWSAWLGTALSFGGLFHEGGILEAHQGLAISPGTLMEDEQLVLAQTGEGILPRESMARLGRQNFEALRTGRFEMGLGGGASQQYHINIQVQSLDAAGVAGLDWDRLVQRHLLPALQKELGRRW